MLCRKPFVQGGHAYGCGQCLPCRISRRRVWATRMMLEANNHVENSFVTLTYSEDKLPKCKDGLTPSLRPEDLQLWLKRMRWAFDKYGKIWKTNLPLKLRFYAVGEYGDKSWRPHYHAALFGYPSCEYMQSTYSKRRVNCCKWCDLVRDTWGLGHVHLGQLEAESAHYICGYVVKKLSTPGDPRLAGRYPEFARQSRRPGIGALMMDDVASEMMFRELEQRLLDVPSSIRLNGKELPLGRYLRQQLRIKCGKEKGAPAEVSVERSKELLGVYLDTIKNPGVSVASALRDANSPRAASAEARLKIYKGKQTL